MSGHIVFLKTPKKDDFYAKKDVFDSKKENFSSKKEYFLLFQIQKRKVFTPMRTSNTHSLTIKRQLNNCKSVFNAYNELQYAYGLKLDNNTDIVEIRCNVKLVDCPKAESYTPDFYCIKLGGEALVRECVDKAKLLKPMTLKLLDISRNYWLSKGITDWGIVLNEGLRH